MKQFINYSIPILMVVAFIAMCAVWIHQDLNQPIPHPVFTGAQIGRGGTSIDIVYNTINRKTSERGESIGTLVFYPNNEIWILSPDGPGVHLGTVVESK